MHLYYDENDLRILNHIDGDENCFMDTYFLKPQSNILSIEITSEQKYQTHIQLVRNDEDAVVVSTPNVVSSQWLYYDKDLIKILNVYDTNFIDHANAYPQTSSENVGQMQLPVNTKMEHLDIRTDESGNIETYQNMNREPFYWTVADWGKIRTKRNARLAETDWTQVVDSALSDEQKANWASYRQTLRDLTTLYNNPSDVVWPEAPLS